MVSAKVETVLNEDLRQRHYVRDNIDLQCLKAT